MMYCGIFHYDDDAMSVRDNKPGEDDALKALYYCFADDERCTGGIVVTTVLCAVFATKLCHGNFGSSREIKSR
jgi:hypothetical protein